jgi:hypothetical protein
MDDPPPSGFDRVVISCRVCGEVETFDLQAGVITAARLRNMTPRCSECRSWNVEIALIAELAGNKKAPA